MYTYLSFGTLLIALHTPILTRQYLAKKLNFQWSQESVKLPSFCNLKVYQRPEDPHSFALPWPFITADQVYPSLRPSCVPELAQKWQCSRLDCHQRMTCIAFLDTGQSTAASGSTIQSHLNHFLVRAFFIVNNPLRGSPMNSGDTSVSPIPCGRASVPQWVC
jgi:hypothetical protein